MNYEIFAGKSCAITGIGGFVGQLLASTLVNLDADVWGLVRDPVDANLLIAGGFPPIKGMIRGDLRYYRDCERLIGEAMPDFVFHLGAMSQVRHCSRMPLQAMETNVMGTANILEAVRQVAAEASLVIFTTDKVYGRPELFPLNENSPLRPAHPYEASKAAADLVAQGYCRWASLSGVILRCGNIYGPGDANWDRIIPGVLLSLMLGKRPVLRSDGTPVRDYLFVADVVDACLRAAYGIREGELGLGEPYVVAGGHPLTVLEVYQKIANLDPAWIDIEPICAKTAGDEAPMLTLDASAFRRATEWEAFTKMEDGLGVTFSWMRAYLEGPDA